MSTETVARGWVPRDDSLGARLALVRQYQGWNVKEAALACGIGVQSWRNWESGGHCLAQEEVARKISARTGCDYFWLFAGNNAPRNPPPNGPTHPADGGGLKARGVTFPGQPLRSVPRMAPDERPGWASPYLPMEEPAA